MFETFCDNFFGTIFEIESDNSFADILLKNLKLIFDYLKEIEHEEIGYKDPNVMEEEHHDISEIFVH